MLEEMRIRSLGVIDDAVVELSPGFTAVTGETGAGKTMVVTSLGLLLGGRADPALVRIGAKAAVVEGRVVMPPDAPAAVRAEEAGAELDEGALLISRTVSAEGRSRAHVGGRSVPVGLLSELADELVAVHGQTDQQGLLRPARQRQALDRYAGDAVAVPLEKYAGAYRRLRAATNELDAITTRARERAQEADLLRFGLDEIAAVEPLPGEDAELAAEAERLGHAESLASAAQAAHAALAGDVEDPEGVDANTLVAGAHRALESVRSHDPVLGGLADRDRGAGHPARRRRRGTRRVRRRPGRRSAAAGRGRGAPGRPDSADPQVRRVRRRGARLGTEGLGTAAGTRRRRRADHRAHRRAGRPARGAVAAGAGPDGRPDGGRRALRRRGHRRAGLPGHAARPGDHRHPPDRGRRRRRGRRAARRLRAHGRGRGRAAARPAPRRPAPSDRQGRLRRRAVPGHAGRRGRLRRHHPRAHLPLRRGGRGRRRQGGRRDRAAAREARQVRAGRRRHPPAAGGGLRGPPAAGGEDRRRIGDPLRSDGPGGRGPDPGALADAGRPGGLPDRPRPRRGTAGGGARGRVTTGSLARVGEAGGRTAVSRTGSAPVWSRNARADWHPGRRL
ncbi:DNA recombination and repair protein [Streptomyces sp. C]|nr:DNA recombination and repair protein [Streptomyces sp. C]